MKSLSERIAERALRQSIGRNARNRAAFLLVRTEVQAAIDDGHSLMSIWEALAEEGHICYGYQAFRRYANELTRKPQVFP
ncbi:MULTISPECIES: TraK family protein [Burkholderiaceae]|uniref:Conjugal transfer protein TraK n=1 Tax=Pandoraea nosoerga TaxID=2508296 RepID=A0A5E4UMF8_9BURK|nr:MULTISPECIES: TraK family protein [Burkholderiaceae]VVE01126.1 conjugal transfer protein TraK [Pandoraea nosoerga]